MEGIFIALPIALVIAVVAVCGFVWAVRRDQFEDLDTPPRRMLTDDFDCRATKAPLSSKERSVS
jgi:cbb3-type cytochrome oxidase maturation protein